MKFFFDKIKYYWNQISIEGRGRIAICIPLICLLTTICTSRILTQQLFEAQAGVILTDEVLAKSQKSLVTLLNAETGIRGYIYTKDKAFLVPYERALATVNSTLMDLQFLVRDKSSEQVERTTRLTQNAKYQLGLFKLILQQTKVADSDSDRFIKELLTEDKLSMDEFKETINELETEEHHLLKIHARYLQQQQEFKDSADLLGFSLSGVVTIISISLLRKLAIELRQNQLNLRDSNNLIEAVFANIIDGVAIVDRQDKITAFNHAALAMFDYSHDRLLGRNWHELLNEDAEQHPQDLRVDRVGGSNEIPISQIWKATGKRKSGELFPIEISIGSIPFKDHRIAIIRDITERIEATNQLSALNNSLHKTNHSLLQSNRELEQFTYITAHDLKAPLRAISGLSEWVEEALEEHLSAETRGQMQLLRRRVHRMQSLLDGLLEYSRAGRIQYPIVTVDVNRTIEKIVLILDPPATFTIDIETPMPTFVTHLQPLEQVFTHLIDNAIRHHPTKTGVVKIYAIDLGDYYEFTVADNGEGIEPEYQTKIYRIFQTLKARDFQENVGAGLAIVQKIVTTQGGTINLESIPGKGATFRFTWPKQIYL